MRYSDIIDNRAEGRIRSHYPPSQYYYSIISVSLLPVTSFAVVAWGKQTKNQGFFHAEFKFILISTFNWLWKFKKVYPPKALKQSSPGGDRRSVWANSQNGRTLKVKNYFSEYFFLNIIECKTFIWARRSVCLNFLNKRGNLHLSFYRSSFLLW